MGVGSITTENIMAKIMVIVTNRIIHRRFPVTMAAFAWHTTTKVYERRHQDP